MKHYLIPGVLLFTACAVWTMPIGIINKIIGCVSCLVVASMMFTNKSKEN